MTFDRGAVRDAASGARERSMSTTNHRTDPMQYPQHSVNGGTLAEHSDQLKTALLSARRGVKRASLDDSVRQLRKDIWCGKAKPCEHILRVLLADLTDGAPLEDVLAFPAKLTAILTAYAAPVPEKPIDVLIDEETIMQGGADCAEFRIARDKSPSALRDADLHLTKHAHAIERLRGAVQQQLYAGAVR